MALHGISSTAQCKNQNNRKMSKDTIGIIVIIASGILTFVFVMWVRSVFKKAIMSMNKIHDKSLEEVNEIISVIASCKNKDQFESVSNMCKNWEAKYSEYETQTICWHDGQLNGALKLKQKQLE